MTAYRKILYNSYRSTIYEFSNSDDFESKIEGYRHEFKTLMPEDKQAKILDLGCGSGYLVYFFIKEGYKNITGIDNSIEQVEFANSQQLPVIRAEALDFLKTNQGFDVILLTDLIEHFQKNEIVELLKVIYESLNPGGYAIIRTGNASCIYGTTMRYIDFTHEIGFTEKSFRQILLAIGFDRVFIDDNKPRFGWKLKRLFRFILFKIWRIILKLIYFIEVGEDCPKLFGKLLIAKAYKSN